MPLKLTDEMREALRNGSDGPVTVEDAQTHRQYVLLPLEVYDHVQSLLVEACTADGLSADELRIYEEARAMMPSADVLMHFVQSSPPISDWDE